MLKAAAETHFCSQRAALTVARGTSAPVLSQGTAYDARLSGGVMLIYRNHTARLRRRRTHNAEDYERSSTPSKFPTPIYTRSRGEDDG